jgi:flagellar hook protein FlgE
MLRSFYIALSGLNTSKDWLDITSNNIANANTIGFKKSRPVFQDIVLQNIFSFNHYSNTVNKITFGGGVYMPTTLIDFSQGSMKFTGKNTDMAIDGDGFFILANSNGARFYSRNGEFRLAQGVDEEGRAVVRLVHSSGLSLLADKIDSKTLQPTGKLEPVTIQAELPPKATESIYATDGSNLDPRSNPIGTDLDPEDATTYDILYTVQVFDKKGSQYDVGVFFKKLNPLVKDSDNNYYHTFILTDDAGNRYFTFKNGNEYIEVSAGDASSTPPASEDRMRLIASNVNVNSGGSDLLMKEVYWYREGDNIYIYGKDKDGNWYKLSADTSAPQISAANSEAAQVENTWQAFVLFKDSSSNKWVDLLDVEDQAKDGNKPLEENGYTYDIVTFGQDGTLYSDWGGDRKIKLSLNNLPASLKNSLALKEVNLEGITQYPIDFALGFQQDGYPPGLIQTISIGEDGTITGVYSNGQSLPLYRLKLAYFTSPQDLVNKGSNVFIAPSTLNPVEQYTGPRSKIRAGSLELSNVDVAEELINMITAEKTYQANAKVVQTGQTILDTTINLKR